MNHKTPDDNDIFQQMMSDVKPLSSKKSAQNRVAPSKPQRQAKQPLKPNETSTPGFALREHVPEVGAEETLFFSRAGLQHRLLRQFKRGEMRPETRLDLHGCTIAEASILLAGFLHDAQNTGHRCISIIHGKGHRSTKGQPALKAQINQWLRDEPSVLAFCSAQAKDGGMGALYVLLRRPS